MGHSFVVWGIIYFYPLGIPRHKLLAYFDSLKAVCNRHCAGDGTWDSAVANLLDHAQAKGLIVWWLSVDSTVNRAQLHGTNIVPQPRELANDKNPLEKPLNRDIGKSRGGLITKIQLSVDR